MTEMEQDRSVQDEAAEGEGQSRARIQREIDAGREAELSTEDYEFAIKQGLIEG